ncbi:MAG: ATP-binding protein, partial [Acidobacteria bacterium]|nr:ATP-binding protein [Acidobacteriota bacterium]
MQNSTDIPTGTVKGPGLLPHEYLFITRDNKRTRIGEFVYYEAEVGDERRRIIGTINARRLVRNLPDAFLSNPGTPPSQVSALIGLDGNPIEIYEIAVETIGYFSRNLNDFVNPRIPPQPGDSVRLASSETLAEMLSPKRAAESGSAHVGSLLTREQGEVPVVLSVKDVVSTHLAILASTGSGKSYTAGVLVEELMRPFNRAAVLIVDPHGEYGTMNSITNDRQFWCEDGYRPEVEIFQPQKIKVRFSTLTAADVKYLLPEGTSDKMLHILDQGFRSLNERLRAEGKRDYLYNYHDLRDEVFKQRQGNENRPGDGGNISSIDGLLWRLDSRFDKPGGIFHAHEHIELQDLYKPGRCTILQLSDIEQHEQQVIVGTLLRRVNKARVMTTRDEVSTGENFLNYPVFTLLEEAHRFAPAGASVVSTNVLKQILSEGRKFGVGIGLITQRPGRLDQDVLSQCMTQIIMRIVNPIDQQTVAQSVEGAGRAMLAELPALTKGQAIICGVGVNTPVMCRIRPRMTVHGGETFDAPTEWLKWHSSGEKSKRHQDEAVYI